MQTQEESASTSSGCLLPEKGCVAIVGGSVLLQSAIGGCLETRGLKCVLFDTQEEFLQRGKGIRHSVVLFLMDSGMMTSAGAIRALTEAVNSLPVVVVSLDLSAGSVHALLRLGVMGVVGSGAGVDEVVSALTAAEKGKVYLDPQLAHIAVCGMAPHRDAKAHSTDTARLSRREEEILQLLCDGLSVKEIGRRLFLSAKTVENHKYNIYRKCGVDCATGLLRFAIHNSLVVC